jgi:hypothetical protein
MAPNDTPNNTAVPGFFMVQQDYHTVRSPLRTGLVLALLARLAVIDPAQRLPFAAQWTRCPLLGKWAGASQYCSVGEDRFWKPANIPDAPSLGHNRHSGIPAR